MQNLKVQLTGLIDAFATAKASNNEMLISMSATALIDFLEGVEVVSIGSQEQSGNSDDGSQVDATENNITGAGESFPASS